MNKEIKNINKITLIFFIILFITSFIIFYYGFFIPSHSLKKVKSCFCIDYNKEIKLEFIKKIIDTIQNKKYNLVGLEKYIYVVPSIIDLSLYTIRQAEINKKIMESNNQFNNILDYMMSVPLSDYFKKVNVLCVNNFNILNVNKRETFLYLHFIYLNNNSLICVLSHKKYCSFNAIYKNYKMTAKTRRWKPDNVLEVIGDNFFYVRYGDDNVDFLFNINYYGSYFVE